MERDGALQFQHLEALFVEIGAGEAPRIPRASARAVVMIVVLSVLSALARAAAESLDSSSAAAAAPRPHLLLVLGDDLGFYDTRKTLNEMASWCYRPARAVSALCVCTVVPLGPPQKSTTHPLQLHTSRVWQSREYG